MSDCVSVKLELDCVSKDCVSGFVPNDFVFTDCVSDKEKGIDLRTMEEIHAFSELFFSGLPVLQDVERCFNIEVDPKGGGLPRK